MRQKNQFPYCRIIFDRLKRATNSNALHSRLGTVQIEVSYRGERKWYATGVRVYKNQYNQRIRKVYNHPNQVVLNRRIDLLSEKANEIICNMLDSFTFERFETQYTRTNTKSFIDWMQDEIEKRKLGDATRKHHYTVLTFLKEETSINTFADLTRKTIIEINEILIAKGLKQPTIRNYHKILKVYIAEAVGHELLTSNPYDGYHVPRGKSEGAGYLTQDDLAKIEELSLDATLDRVRDLFLFQCETGMSYADIATFDFNNLEWHDRHFWLHFDRVKTKQHYHVMMTERCMDILDKYKNTLPVISQQKYNMYLKVIQAFAGIKTKMTSHVGRKTFATLMLSRGVPMHIVQHMLGHAKITTTELYAKTTKADVVSQYLTLIQHPTTIHS